MTIPRALEVDGMAAWVHYSHARPADPFALQKDYRGDGWEAMQHPPTL